MESVERNTRVEKVDKDIMQTNAVEGEQKVPKCFWNVLEKRNRKGMLRA
jgi:hypothetical protein